MTIAAADVSVVMTVRDGERYLGEALDSILQQRPSPGEVVVVDDGSRDRTPELLDAYAEHVTVIRQPPQGIASGVNHGIAASSLPVLAFLDADDLWTPDALAARVVCLGDQLGIEAVFGQVEQFVSPDLPREEADRFRFDPEPSHVRLFGAMVVSRAAYLRVGMLDEHLPVGSTIDWISRAHNIGLRFAGIADVVLRRRLHRANVGRTTSEAIAHQALHDVVRAHHERRLQSPATPVDP